MLGIKRTTLYTYVSRGLVRCVPQKGTKQSRYVRMDLERLKVRHDARAGHAAVASGALRWGEPVIDSSVTRIDARGAAYRGHLAVEMVARGASFEAVTELLWTGQLPAAVVRWPAPPLPFLPSALKGLLPAEAPPLAVLSAVVPLLGAADSVRFAASPEQEWLRARRLLRLLGAWVGAVQGPGRVAEALAQDSLAAGLVQAWGVKARGAAGLLDRALVLCADHELNVSTFAVRVARAVADAMREEGHPPPTVDFGLVALAAVLGLPRGAATALFAVRRAAGWVAHVLEQREQGHVLRPRARYVEAKKEG
ncbi:citrate synthase [Stigmatella erecta]|uniref:Citrate synthase n=1 Tax=Stigmatella erecta TaxID=83460 RepID=A0A1I0L9L7_9BACT|nr:citrate synthase [Stigmatella erecta]